MNVQHVTWTILLASCILTGCSNPLEPSDTPRDIKDIDLSIGTTTQNGQIYAVNPIIGSEKSNLSSADFGRGLVGNIFITDEPFLQGRYFYEQAYTADAILPKNEDRLLFRVLENREPNTNPITSNGGRWFYREGTEEFYQVNTFYHLDRMNQRIKKALGFAHALQHFQSPMRLAAPMKSNYLNTDSLWLHDEGVNRLLTAYSNCKPETINSFFSSAEGFICLFGGNEDLPNFKMTQDPSVIYHENAHVWVKIMMNQRNIKFNNNTGKKEFVNFHSELGKGFYDEAGALNEGIADWFSYFMNRRKKIGEWGMGRFFNQARPMSEADPQHASTVASSPTGKLSYPTYLNYDSNDPQNNYESIHLAGQIVSHYLVTLTEEFKNSCFDSSMTVNSAVSQFLTDVATLGAVDFNRQSLKRGYSNDYHAQASAMTLMLINNTLAEAGDLMAKGSDLLDEDATNDNDLDGLYFTNLNPENSYLWTHQVNPINYRRFFRIFAKNIKYYISEGICPSFTLDESEALLDAYGLLLFKSYEDKMKTTDNTQTVADFADDQLALFDFDPFNEKLYILNPATANTYVDEGNRRNTTLVAKDLIDITDESNIGFVFDNPQTIKKLLTTLSFEGTPLLPTPDIAGVEYNNGNGKISPGEILGLHLNLKNFSNTTMAGIQVLANDWDHMKLQDPTKVYVDSEVNMRLRGSDIAYHSPCIFDGWPTTDQGGNAADDANTPGNCSYITRDNTTLDLTENDPMTLETTPKYDLDAPQPICLVEYADENETRWVTQDFYRKVAMELSDNECLNNPSMSGENFNPNECLIRMLPGADQANYSQIKPGLTWAQSIIEGTDQEISFNQSSAVLMEVSKWIGPGTKFNCRFRVRFSNCMDCFAPDLNSEDYADFEYAGAQPYKIINFQFQVVD